MSFDNLNFVDADTKRRIAFIFGCIPFRLAIAYMTSRASFKTRKMIGGVFMLVGIVMLYLALAQKRLYGPETFGKNIWWTPHMRIIHAILYFIFAILAWIEYEKSYWVLYLDAFVGLIAFIFHESFH